MHSPSVVDLKWFAAIAIALAMVPILTEHNTAAAGEVTFMICDAAAKIRVHVTLDEVDRKATRVTVSSGEADLVLKLRPTGLRNFRILTHMLATRGAVLHKQQRMVFSLNGRVYATVPIDYRTSPDGLDARGGLHLIVAPKIALRLARQIRGG